MKTYLILALVTSALFGCGSTPAGSVVKTDQGTKPEFEQFVSIEIKAEDVSAYQTLISDYAKVSRAEPGNVLYALYQSLDDPAQFEVHETWDTDAAHTAHLATPEFKAYSDQANPMFASPPIKERIN